MLNLDALFKYFSKNVEINFIKVNMNNFESSFNNFRIVQISDLHINKWNKDFIESCAEKINHLNADILVITGDMICSGKKYLSELKSILNKINTNYGKFACLGNHDYSDDANGNSITDLYAQSGIQLLNNSSSYILRNGEKLFIAGCDDAELGKPDVEKSLKNVKTCTNILYLTHNPSCFKEISNQKNCLVLAGHTHGMQLNFKILSNIYRSYLKTNYFAGEYQNNKSILYVNKGLGTALCTPNILGLKFTVNTPRINIHPEISVFDLVNH